MRTKTAMDSYYSGCVRLVCVTALTILGALTAPAQNASLRGQITDPSGASVPNASVVLRKAPNTERRTNTDAQGSYSFTNLTPGTYDLTVTRPGFAPFSMQSFAVNGPSTADV